MTDPKPEELITFLNLLLEDAPDGYEPWLFRCEAGSKAPDLSYGSWKKDRARLTKEEAIRWMESGGNVGIAGTPEDALVNVDIDDEDETTPDDLKQTLIARSRSRTGVHAWYFAEDEDIPNIPTDDAGEVRTNWQYVVAPGSYVETDPDDVPDDERDMAGYYSVEREQPVASLSFDELPAVFQRATRGEPDVSLDDLPGESGGSDDVPTPDSGDRDAGSALFDITAEDVASRERGRVSEGDRWTAIFHGSDTGKNMSLSSEGLLHCWRHEVAHNGLQALTVLSGYHGGCSDVGSAHEDSGAGRSCIRGEGGAHIWYAWKYAKQNGYLPDDDPVPYSALKHLCKSRGFCAVSELPDDENGSIPGFAYDAALSSIRNHDGLDPGRVTTDEIDDSAERQPSAEELVAKYSDQYDGSTEVPEDASEACTSRETAADGGATASDPDASDSEDKAGEEWNPAGVVDMALMDDYGRFSLPLGDDEDPPTVHDLRTGEKTRYLWDLMEATGRDDVLATDDNRFLSLNDSTIWVDEGEQRLRQYARETLRAAYKAGTLEQLKDETHGRHRVDRDELGTPWRTVAMENGLLDVETGNLMDLEPHHYAIRHLPFEYDPDAEREVFDDFISEVVPDPHERRKLQEYAGYTLLKDEQPHGKALFLVGPKNSGKSTFLKALRGVLGDENVAAQSLKSLVDTRWGIAQLQGTFANTRNEVTPGGITQVETFKELTGGGNMMAAERKGEQKFKVEVTQKFLFATNEMPDIDKVDDAFIERLMFVRFPDTIPRGRQDGSLDEKLRDERAGILNWMLEGLTRLLDRGRFTRERGDGEKRELLDAFGGVLDRFKHRVLEITGDEEDIVVKDDLYNMANHFAELTGKEPEWSDKGTFTKMLKKEPGVGEGQVRTFGDRKRIYRGIRVDEEKKRAYDGEIRDDRASDGEEPDEITDAQTSL